MAKNKYPIDPQLPQLKNVPMPSFVLSMGNAVLSLHKLRGDEKVKVSHTKVESYDGAKIPVTVISPVGIEEPAACLVYHHGGGFATKAAPYHFQIARDYALGAGCKVVMSDYRLAPKHPYPAAAEDAFAVYSYAAGLPDVDSSRLAMGGDSAGGNLAAACCLMARDRGLAQPCFQLLIYPVTDRRMDYESMRLFNDTPMWNAPLNRRMWKWYLPEGAEHVEYASPIEAESLEKLPPAYVETAQFDCLRDEGAAYAQALMQAGVPVELNQTLGTVHGYDILRKGSLVQGNIHRRIQALKRAFEGQGEKAE